MLSGVEASNKNNKLHPSTPLRVTHNVTLSTKSFITIKTLLYKSSDE